MHTDTASTAGDDQQETIGDFSIDHTRDVTVRNTTLDAAECATHHPNQSTPPPRNTTPPTQPPSTPFAKSVSEDVYNHRGRDALYPLLENDIKCPTTITFKEFLDHVLQFRSPNDIDLEAISQSQETLEYFSKFEASLKKPEVGRYEPFTLLVNHVLMAIAKQKSTQPSIFAHPHDNFDVRGSSGAVRRPDIVFSSIFNPTSHPLHWSDVMMVLEFKAKQGIDSTREFSKSREGSDSARSPMPSTTSSATSGVSTDSKRRRDLLVSDSTANKTLRMTDSDPKSVELQLASYALEPFAHGHYRSHVVHGTILESMLRL
jgi:RNAse (barnase) inhibitor barstar